jgi:hypothetical protein
VSCLPLREAVSGRFLELLHALIDIFVQDGEFEYPSDREGKGCAAAANETGGGMNIRQEK